MSLAAEASAPQQVWASLDQARRNAAYDNNAAVANSAALIEARNAASAKYREAHPRGRVEEGRGSLRLLPIAPFPFAE